MNNHNLLEMQYQIQATINSLLNKAKRNETPLSIAKLKLNFDPKKGDEFRSLLSFIYEFLDFTPFIGVGGGEYIFFLEDTKIHTAVITLKNMLISANITYKDYIMGIGVTTLEKGEKLEDCLKRVYALCDGSIKSSPVTVHYATSSFTYSDKDAPNGLKSIFVKEPKVTIYGFYKEAPMMQDGQVIEYNESEFVIKLAKEYLTFLKRESFAYIENSLVPDIMKSDIIKIDLDKSLLYLGELKFLDDSPVHRKNIRVTPHRPIKATLSYKDEFVATSIISDLSKNSILLSTQLPKIEELLAKELRNKKFDLHFYIEEDDGSKQEIFIKAMIFKITGNQIILRTFLDSDTEAVIHDYIQKCQKILLLEAQGIRV